MTRHDIFRIDAERRGLSIDDCREAIGLNRLSVSEPEQSTSALCLSALNGAKTHWEQATIFSNSVAEAERLGLTVDDCREAIGLKRLSVSEHEQLTSSLCISALNGAKKEWERAKAFYNAVAEAKRRNLSVDDCRVAIGLEPLNATPSQTPEVVEVNPPSPKPLSLTEICEQSLNTEKTGWSNASSTADARRQAASLGITVDACRSQLGLAAVQIADNNNDTTPAPTTAVEPDAITGRRVALVVGINDYENLPQLQKAVNDSRAVTETLTRIGYDVVSVENPDRRTLNRKLSELQGKIQPGDNALFYFAGHGVALGGENILIAKDMPEPASGDEDLVRSEGFSVDDIVRRIQKQGAKTAFLVLDACRDNPFEATGTRSIGNTRGLAKTDTPSGVFVLFSAGIGQAALDRLSDTDSDPNSVFTRELLPVLGKRGLTLTGLAKAVQKDVADLAATINHQQQPAYYDQIIGEVVINPQ